MNQEASLAKRSELHLERRIWHTSCGVVCLVLYPLLSFPLLYWGVLAFFIACLGFFFDFKRLNNLNFNEKFTNLLRPIMRKSEKVSFSGLPFYAMGCALSIFLYEEKIALLSILFLIFADPFASIIGVHYGTDRLLPNKTVQGTIAAFFMCLFISVFYVFLLVGTSANFIIFIFFGALAGMFSELLSAFNIDDNLTIPVVSGAVLSVLNYWLKVL